MINQTFNSRNEKHKAYKNKEGALMIKCLNTFGEYRKDLSPNKCIRCEGLLK